MTADAVRVARHWGPVWDGYFADPFVLRLADGGYVAYGTHPGSDGDRVFEALVSPDLEQWESAGAVLERLPAGFGEDYWAPEVAEAGGAYWMYYSVGRGIEGHHLRVARADAATGPFTDLGVNLTPDEVINLMHAASVAMAEGEDFRLAFDGSFKYKVGGGMWTAPILGERE